MVMARFRLPASNSMLVRGHTSDCVLLMSMRMAMPTSSPQTLATVLSRSFLAMAKETSHAKIFQFLRIRLELQQVTSMAIIISTSRSFIIRDKALTRARTVSRFFMVTAKGSPFPTGHYPPTVATGDLNSDGLADLAIPNNMEHSVTIYLGGRNGIKQDGSPIPVGRSPQRVAIGDLNEDGKTDLAVANEEDNDVWVL